MENLEQAATKPKAKRTRVQKPKPGAFQPIDVTNPKMLDTKNQAVFAALFTAMSHQQREGVTLLVQAMKDMAVSGAVDGSIPGYKKQMTFLKVYVPRLVPGTVKL